MPVNLLACDHADEDYIDMEVSSYSSLICHSISSPPHPREFEFQMSSITLQREPSTSPADELFYNGKLLPLHLPPRLQMVEKLLQNSHSAYDDRKDTFEEVYCTPLTTTMTTPTTTNTPFESCNISPSESCQVSRELNPDKYFFKYSTEVSGFIEDIPKKSWTRKLKRIKHSSLGSKLKASRAYLKSLFGKSGCLDESCAVAAKKEDEGSVSKAKECLNRHAKSVRENPFVQIQKDNYQMSNNIMGSFDTEKTTKEHGNHHRRSFSVSIKRHSTNKFSSSSLSSDSSPFSCSNNSNRFQQLKFLRRSISSNSELESPIQGAIAHCKQSQQVLHSRKTAREVEFYSSASRMALCENQERPDLCRG